MTEDEHLLQKLRSSDTSAVEEIIDKYSHYVVSVIMNRLGSSASIEDAEEQASDVFFSLWQHRHRLRTDNLRGWLAAAARNSACSSLRKKHFETSDIDDCLTVADVDMEKLAEENERSEYLKRTLDVLDKQSREIFVRYFYLSQTAADISKALSLNLSTVKSRLRRGRAKLREELIKGGYSCED